MIQTTTPLRGAILSVALLGCASTTAGGTPVQSPMGASGTTARGGDIRKGQTVEGVLNRGEEHAWAIELTPGERVHFDVTGTTEQGPQGERCENWSWSWNRPTGEWLNGNPLPLEVSAEQPTAPRTASADVAGMVPIDEPLGGRWTFRLSADQAGCHRIRYRLSAR
jgi:hypothetical protein